MTPVRLIIKNLSRNRRRTFLTAGSVAVSISLFTTLIPAWRASRISIAEALRFVG